MALPLVIANTVQVRLLWSVTGQLAVNVLHGIVPTGFVSNQTVANSLGSAIKAAFTTNIATAFPASNSLVRVGLRDIRQANQTEFLDTSAAAPGGAPGDALPGGVAMCITMRTALSGKSNRGRIYLSGFSESENSATGSIVGTTVSAALAFMAAIDTAMDAQQITMAIASRPAERFTIVKTTFHSDGTSSTDTLTEGKARAGASNAVTAFQSRTALWESQRRRQNGRGVAPTSLQAGTIVETRAAGRSG